MDDLSTKQDILIKPAHKGGALDKMNKQDYVKEATRQLSESSFYQLTGDPTKNFKKEIKNTLASPVKNNKIEGEIRNSLIPFSLVAGKF